MTSHPPKYPREELSTPRSPRTGANAMGVRRRSSSRLDLLERVPTPALERAAGQHAPLDDMLEAKPSTKRLRVLGLLSLIWLMPPPQFTYYFASLPYDVDKHCTCGTPDAATMHDPFEHTHHGIAADLNGSTVERRLDVCKECDNPHCKADHTTFLYEFEFFCNTKVDEAFLGVLFFFGVGMGAFMGGLMSDKYGRRNAFMWNYTASVVSYLGVPLMPNAFCYGICSFCLGLFQSSAVIVGFTLASELVGKSIFVFGKYRPRTFLTIEVWGYMWAINSSIVPIIAWLLQDYSWRLLMFVYALPSAFHVAACWIWMCESPRWLIANNMRAEAQELLQELTEEVVNSEKFDVYARPCSVLGTNSGNNSPAPGVRAATPMIPIDDASQTTGEIEGIDKFADLFREWSTARITLCTAYLWFAASVAYYAISFNAGNLDESVYLDFFLVSIPTLPATWFGAYIMNHPSFGRTRASALFFGSSTVCMMIGAVWPASSTAMSMVGNFMAVASFNLCYTWVPELFPTWVRNLALGLASGAGRVGAVIGIVAPYALGKVGVLVVVSFVCLLAGVISTFVMPETLGQPLPEHLPGFEEFAGDVDAEDEPFDSEFPPPPTYVPT